MPRSSSNGAACPLPTSKDNQQYKQILTMFEKVGPKDDPMFNLAIDMLSQTTPTEANKELMTCSMKGKSSSGTRSKRMSVSGGASSKSRSRSRSANAAKTPVSKKDQGRLKCYLKIMTIMAAGAASITTAGYYLLVPFVTTAVGSPCKGLTDQIFGAIGGIMDNQLSCAARQAAYDNLVSNYLSGVATTSGMSITAMMWKAPELFRLVFKYLKHKFCKDIYKEKYTWDNLIGEWEQIRGNREALVRANSSEGSKMADPAEATARRRR